MFVDELLTLEIATMINKLIRIFCGFFVLFCISSMLYNIYDTIYDTIILQDEYYDLNKKLYLMAAIMLFHFVPMALGMIAYLMAKEK